MSRSPEYKARLVRARQRKAAGVRRVPRAWIDPDGLTWHGRVIESDGSVLLAVHGPLEVRWDVQLHGDYSITERRWLGGLPVLQAPALRRAGEAIAELVNQEERPGLRPIDITYQFEHQPEKVSTDA